MTGEVKVYLLGDESVLELDGGDGDGWIIVMNVAKILQIYPGSHTCKYHHYCRKWQKSGVYLNA